MGKVSIIVPVYNVESYLEECLDSIVSQTFTDMEIILVDDGSTDKSLEIMKKYACKDKRIILSMQSNRGVSAARNKGLKLATGAYIFFVDSDDMIKSDTVERLYQHAIKTGSDIIIGNATCLFTDGTTDVIFPRNRKMLSIDNISGDLCYAQLMETNGFPPVVYLYFIRYDIIRNNQLYFKEGIVHEDELWCVQAMLHSSKISLIEFNYYYYRQRKGSIMNSDNKKYRANSLITVVKELQSLALGFRQFSISKESIGYIYVRMIFIYCRITEMLNPSDPFLLLCDEFFSQLLITIYHELSYSQQKICLNNYYIAKMIINEIIRK